MTNSEDVAAIAADDNTALPSLSQPTLKIPLKMHIMQTFPFDHLLTIPLSFYNYLYAVFFTLWYYYFCFSKGSQYFHH